MADTYVVLAHVGNGEIAGAFSTLALAQACIGAKPSVGYKIVLCTIDGDIGFTLSQSGAYTATRSTMSPHVPDHKTIKDGRPG